MELNEIEKDVNYSFDEETKAIEFKIDELRKMIKEIEQDENSQLKKSKRRIKKD